MKFFFKKLAVTTTISMVLANQSFADLIINIGTEGFAAGVNNWPGGEPPSAAIDGAGQKYLNFGKENTGIVVTPTAGGAPTSLTYWAANDSPNRDPASFWLGGTNGDSVTGDYTFIASGLLALPDSRNQGGTAELLESNSATASFTNDASFTNYLVVFPTLKGNDNSMQVADVQLFDAAGTGIFAPGDTILGVQVDGALVPDDGPLVPKPSTGLLLSTEDQIIGGILTDTGFIEGSASGAANGNNWPGGEPPEELIDGSFGGGGAKYLNFFKLNTGVIITPTVGASVVDRITFWTANDAESRDPASFQLYGTNKIIIKGGPGTTYPTTDFTLITEGALELPSDRATIATPIGDPPFSTGPFQTVDFSNTKTYTSFMLIFPTVKDASSANSMQVSEVAFENVINSSIDPAITEINYDKATDMVDVTWVSQPGQNYILYYSPDLIDWSTDIADSIEAKDDSEVTTFGPFLNPNTKLLKGFFRVEKN